MSERFHGISRETRCLMSMWAGQGNRWAEARRLPRAVVAQSLRAVIYLCIAGLMAGLLTSCCCEKRQESHVQVTRSEQDRIPPALQRIGQRAEGIVLAVPTDNWPRVYAYIQEIDDAWKDYKHPTVSPPSEPAGFPARLMVRELDAALASLKRAAAARDATGTMKAANDVNAVATDLFAFYNPTMPPDMHSLAVLERRILLDSADGDLTRASSTLSSVRNAWDRVRTTIFDHVGHSVVSEFDRHIIDQQAALDAGDSNRLSSTAKQALTMIDQMERLYYPDTEGLG
jgi:hypothetical protein